MRQMTSILLSLLIVALLWYHIDARAILTAMRDADPLWLGAGLLWVVPLTIGTSWRFGLLSRTELGLPASTRLILSASTLNLLLPSKMGDVAKAWVLRTRYRFDGRHALALVLLEKLTDLASLLAWGVGASLLMTSGLLQNIATAGLALLLGLLLLLLSPINPIASFLRRSASWLPARIGKLFDGFGAQWGSTIEWFWHSRGRAALVWVVSLLLWAGHLVQIWMFARAMGQVPLAGSMAAATLAILAGLLPFTMAGIGTRDAALVVLYAAWLSPAQGAALGVLATMRYLLPAIAGLPFVHDYWAGRGAARQS